jgi:hypothetical protein
MVHRPDVQTESRQTTAPFLIRQKVASACAEFAGREKFDGSWLMKSRGQDMTIWVVS